ncbi:hypothetical protein A9D60_13790 [Leisingera sp. JC1]|nr:hypothetical protein A9D60_13790 [Leisingera sp. JC1]
MRIATYIEVYVRDIVRELVDVGDPYTEAGGKLVKSAKLDLVFAAHLAGKKLSLGDFVAHSISINGIDAVVSSLSGLIEGFVPKLKNSHELWAEEANTWPHPPIIEDYDRTIGTLSEMFEIRHVLTHELPKESVVEHLDLDWLCEAACKFVDACDWVVVSELHSSLPRTQTTMNVNAAEQLNSTLERLTSTANELEGLSGLNQQDVADVQEKWKEFAEAEASLVASRVEGGSMYSMVWSSAKERLAEDRILQLQRLKASWMD